MSREIIYHPSLTTQTLCIYGYFNLVKQHGSVSHPMEASRCGHAAIVRMYLRQNPMLGAYLFCNECKYGNQENIQLLLPLCQNVTYLEYAILGNQLPIVKKMLPMTGVNPRCIHLAVLYERKSIIEYLVQQEPSRAKKCLWSAVESGKLSMVRYLFRYPIDTDQKLVLDISDQACIQGSVDIVKYFIQQGWSTEKRCIEVSLRHHDWLLLQSILTQVDLSILLRCLPDLKTFKYALDRYPDGEEGSLDLLMGVYGKRNKSLFRLVLDKFEWTAKQLNGAFLIACQNGDLTTVKTLLSQGSNIHTHNGKGLLLAIESRNKELVRYLVSNSGTHIHRRHKAERMIQNIL